MRWGRPGHAWNGALMVVVVLAIVTAFALVRRADNVFGMPSFLRERTAWHRPSTTTVETTPESQDSAILWDHKGEWWTVSPGGLGHAHFRANGGRPHSDRRRNCHHKSSSGRRRIPLALGG